MTLSGLSLEEYCDQELRRLLDPEQLAMLERSRELKRLAASDPHLHPRGKQCVATGCGKWFVSENDDYRAAYCSDPCKHRSSRERRKAA